MAQTNKLQILIDTKLKEDGEQIAREEYGVSLSQAVRIFINNFVKGQITLGFVQSSPNKKRINKLREEYRKDLKNGDVVNVKNGSELIKSILQRD